MNDQKTNIAIAAGALVLWGALTFGITLETGWVHLPLGAAVIFIARAIIMSDNTPPE